MRQRLLQYVYPTRQTLYKPILYDNVYGDTL